jgi:hypothetical protein
MLTVSILFYTVVEGAIDQPQITDQHHHIGFDSLRRYVQCPIESSKAYPGNPPGWQHHRFLRIPENHPSMLDPPKTKASQQRHLPTTPKPQVWRHHWPPWTGYRSHSQHRPETRQTQLHTDYSCSNQNGQGEIFDTLRSDLKIAKSCPWQPAVGRLPGDNS